MAPMMTVVNAPTAEIPVMVDRDVPEQPVHARAKTSSSRARPCTP
jgi:hypothetical protein